MKEKIKVILRIVILVVGYFIIWFLIVRIPLFFFPNDYLIKQLVGIVSLVWFGCGIYGLLVLWEEKSNNE